MRTATVVGSGPNGLAGAVRLAQAGLRVTVLEGADEIGGGTRSGELSVPGVIHDHCSAFHPLGAASPYLTTLPLHRYGLRWRWADIDCAHPLDDGTAALLYRDLDRTVEELGADGARWRSLVGPLAGDFGALADEILQPVAHLPRHPITLSRFGLRALAPADRTARRFETAAAQGLFTGIAAHAFTRLDRPGTAAAGLMLAAAGHHAGWPVAEGGSAAITRALAALLHDLGGTVRTGVPVTDIAEIPSDLVLLDVMPDAAARILGGTLPSRVSRAFRRYPRGPAAFKVDYVIDGDVGWAAPGCARAGTVHLGGTTGEIAAAESSVVAGRMPDRPFTLVGQQWLADPGRATGNLRPLWAYAHVPNGYPDTDRAVAAVTAQIDRFAPGFSDRIVDVRPTPPAALASANPNYRGGDIGGGRNDLWHLVARPRSTLHPYATGVDGVFLCSAATPPGGGVHGMCGFRAAEAALAATNGDVRRPRPRRTA
ncbi:NAD(P)/FAD-dependent oxidoreductase [Gordonia sinesedis]